MELYVVVTVVIVTVVLQLWHRGSHDRPIQWYHPRSKGVLQP